jgi:hypothetical protein
VDARIFILATRRVAKQRKLMVPDLRNDDNFAYLLRNKTAQASHKKLFG